jgi:hypothetical protein
MCVRGDPRAAAGGGIINIIVVKKLPYQYLYLLCLFIDDAEADAAASH